MGGATMRGHEAPGVQETIPEWWSHACEYPHWYVWRGVAGHFYARVLRTSPPKVVRALTAEGLRDEIRRAESPTWSARTSRPVPRRREAHVLARVARRHAD
jgi:hypothetical protein